MQFKKTKKKKHPNFEKVLPWDGVVHHVLMVQDGSAATCHGVTEISKLLSSSVQYIALDDD